MSRSEDEVLYGGAAGGGKSDSLVIYCILRATKYSGSKALFLRRTYADLSKAGAALDRSKELLSGVAKYDQQLHRWTFPNASVLDFGYLDHEDDKLHYQSAQYDTIAFDELTQFTETQYLYLLSRCRATVDGILPRIRGGCNPGGIGHSWVKARFVDAAPPETRFELPRQPDQTQVRYGCFVPARLQDNQILMTRDPGYWDRLMALPEDDRRALAYGDWDVFAGQYFTEWRREKHVIQPFAIPKHWRRFGSLDWGYAKPLAFYVMAQDPDANRVYVVRELYAAGLRDGEACARINSTIGTDQLDAIWADPSMWQKKSADNALSTAEVYIKAGLPLQPANNDRLNGWRRLRELLADGKDGMPMLQVWTNCTNLIRTLPGLVHDQAKPEDLNCFVAGTQILTPRGPRNIEDIEVGDLVCTPIGDRSVIRAGPSGCGQTLSVPLSNGCTLTGTPNHKVFVHGRGLIRLDSLSQSDILGTRRTTEWKLRIRGSLTDGDRDGDTTNQTAHTWQKGILPFMSKCTSTPMARFRRATKSIISIMITTTIARLIYWLCQDRYMLVTTSPYVNLIQSSKASITDGIGVRVGEKPCARMPKRCVPIRQNMNLRAQIVAQLVERDLLDRVSTVQTGVSMSMSERPSIFARVRSAALSLAARIARLSPFKPVRISAVGSYAGERVVYNLTVDEAGLYYANGILVTNTDGEDHSADSVRYGVVMRMTAQAEAMPLTRPFRWGG